MGKIIVGGIIEKNNKYLLVQEAKEKCKGKWNLPAGYLDVGESVIEGAKREVEEETGCKVEINGILEIGNIINNNEPFVSIIFSTNLIEDEIKYDSKEILDVKWFTYEEVISIKENLRSDKHIINAVEACRNNKIASLDVINIFSE